MSSLESLTQIPLPINTNINSQVFMSSSIGSALSSINVPQVWIYRSVNEDMFEGEYDLDRECRPFYDAIAETNNIEEVPDESTP